MHSVFSFNFRPLPFRQTTMWIWKFVFFYSNDFEFLNQIFLEHSLRSVWGLKGERHLNNFPAFVLLHWYGIVYACTSVNSKKENPHWNSSNFPPIFFYLLGECRQKMFASSNSYNSGHLPANLLVFSFPCTFRVQITTIRKNKNRNKSLQAFFVI